ncbi:MAG: RNA-binding protein [Bacteroidota bacterium]|nr:RNA-binding protein [Bacteroidota bacterium]
MAKLFVVGFPKDKTEVELLEMFSVHGTVNTITIVTDQHTGASKGYGFVTMTDQAGADRAIAALDGAEFGDRQMSVRIAETKNVVNQPVTGIVKGKRPRKMR